jgi:prophage regulatory protein
MYPEETTRPQVYPQPLRRQAKTNFCVGTFCLYRQRARVSALIAIKDSDVAREWKSRAFVDDKGMIRAIRRKELREVVPLADSTIYEMEQKGEFPQRFALGPRCVVWDLNEVQEWLERRRANSITPQSPPRPYRERN